MIAFLKFKEIEKLKTLQEKHKEWLKDYEGLSYSISHEEKHKIKWMKEPKYYFNKIWTPEINCIKERKDRLKIEFDDENAKEHLEEVQKKLEQKEWGFIRSTHYGRCDYLWIEFTRGLTEKEKQAFLIWIAPDNSEIDLNFASSRKIFQVLYAIHWRHSFQRETPIKYFENQKIDFDSLGIKPKEITIRKKIIKRKDFTYVTGIKEASKVFTLEDQTKRFNKIQPLFYDKSGLWWLWNTNDFKWEIVDEVDILNMIHEVTGKEVISSKSRMEILNALKQEGRKNMPKPIKKTWIQFKDKIVDYKTGKEFEATPEYFATNPIPYSFSNEKYIETPIMDRIFDEWVGENHVKTLYEIIAYCLIPDYPLHRLFCFIGDGLNGKTCFIRLLKRFLGRENVTSTELDILLNSRFEITRLHKKLVCVMGETNFAEMNKTSIIKKLTGQDLIGFEYKNKNPFDDVNYAKIIIATNNLPSTTDKTIGFYRRWLIIDFPNRFSEQKDILEDIPEEEYQYLATKSLILLKDLLDKREFHEEGTIQDRERRYEEKSDPLEKFIKEFTDIDDPNEHIKKWEFEQRLNGWLKENRYRSMSDRTIAKKMKEKGITDDRVTAEWWEDDKPIKRQVRAWIGIKWREKEGN